MTLTRSIGSLSIVGVIALYTLVHVAYVVAEGTDVQDSVFLWAGPVSLICMCFAILISTRPRLVEDYFGGLDRMYQVHKWLGISAMILFALHFAQSLGGGGGGRPDMGMDVRAGGGSGGGEWIEATGMYPMIGFFLLILLTLNRKFAYHHWIRTHLLMGLLFIGVSVHAVLVLLEGREIAMASLPGAMIMAAAIVGVLAYFYKPTFFRTAKAHAFNLAEVNRMERATEVVLSPAADRFAFEPGQFAFLRIRQPGFDEAHPFTISSGTKD